jgi:predicted O-methyltransferase YrrM
LTKKEKLQLIDDERRGIMQAVDPRLPVFMSSVEFSQLAALAVAVAPRHILEWGSGGSTAALLKLLPEVQSYVSIEHNAAWYERVKAAVSDARLHLKYVPGLEQDPVIPPRTRNRKRSEILRAWFTRCETEPELMADYVRYPTSVRNSYDFILVDGRARVHCLKVGFELLSSNGVMAIHDAQRADYRQAIESFSHHLFLEPWIQGQLCVIRKP